MPSIFDSLDELNQYPMPGSLAPLNAIRKAISPYVPPLETQEVPTANALEYSNFKDLYGRTPRKGEIETENVNPASYLAGQISGTNVAAGAPGPRYGLMNVSPKLQDSWEETKKLLPLRILNRLEKDPRTVRIREDYPSNPDWSGSYSPTEKTVRVSPVQGPKGRVDTILHEATHGGADLADVYNQKPGGLGFRKETERQIQASYGPDYTLNKEILPNAVEPSSNALIDWPEDAKGRDAFLKYMEQYGLSPQEEFQKKLLANQGRRSSMKGTATGVETSASEGSAATERAMANFKAEHPESGWIKTSPEFAHDIQPALDAMEPEVADYLQRMNQLVTVKHMTQEEKELWKRRGHQNIGGVQYPLPNRASEILLDPGMSPSARAYVLSHEKGHAGEHATISDREKGVNYLQTPIPGAKPAPGFADKLASSGYSPKETQTEFFADMMAGPRRQALHGHEIHDPDAYIKFLRERFPQLPNDRTIIVDPKLSDPASKESQMFLADWLKTHPKSGPVSSFREALARTFGKSDVSGFKFTGHPTGTPFPEDLTDFFANAPRDLQNKIMSMVPVSHTMDPSTKEQMYKSLFAYMRKKKAELEPKQEAGMMVPGFPNPQRPLGENAQDIWGNYLHRRYGKAPDLDKSVAASEELQQALVKNPTDPIKALKKQLSSRSLISDREVAALIHIAEAQTPQILERFDSKVAAQVRGWAKKRLGYSPPAAEALPPPPRQVRAAKGRQEDRMKELAKLEKPVDPKFFESPNGAPIGSGPIPGRDPLDAVPSDIKAKGKIAAFEWLEKHPAMTDEFYGIGGWQNERAQEYLKWKQPRPKRDVEK